ncbi:hypothetical protein PTKIN_Ptkin10aG0195000 [Pterospermum kingtungense]
MSSYSSESETETERESEPESESTSSQEPCLRNWLDLPWEVTASILLRLGAIEIFESAQKVCTQWRSICKEPSMWRSIDMWNLGDLHDRPYNLEKMCMHAIDRSACGLVDINIAYFGTDDLLSYIAQRTSNLKRLRLIMCWAVSDERLSEAASKFPLLEELEIYWGNVGEDGMKAVGRCCPLLKTFKCNQPGCRDPAYQNDEDAIAIAENMRGLHHLQLIGNYMTNKGLKAILDGCPYLESLDLRSYGDHSYDFYDDRSFGFDYDDDDSYDDFLSRAYDDGLNRGDGLGGYDGYDDFDVYDWLISLQYALERLGLPKLVRAPLGLGVIEIIESVQKVCTQWRDICKDPLVWRSIDMCNLGELHAMPYDLEKMCMHAIDRSCGGLVDISIEFFGTNEPLTYIAQSYVMANGKFISLIADYINHVFILMFLTEQVINLRRLRLVVGRNVSYRGLSEAASNFPLLEELEIYLCDVCSFSIKAVGRCCPLLQTFKYNQWASPNFHHYVHDDEALAIAKNMHGLRHLQLVGNRLSNQGLEAILDGCLYLESLDLRNCFNVNLEGDLGKRCAEQIKNLRRPDDS